MFDEYTFNEFNCSSVFRHTFICFYSIFVLSLARVIPSYNLIKKNQG